MQKKRVPEKRYRELTDQGLRQMIREGRYEDAVRVTTKFTQRTITRSFKSLLAKLPEPTLDKRSYETLREIILGIVKKKVPGATTPPTKVDFVKRFLDKEGISVPEEEIETVLNEDPLNEDADDRASRQAVLGIFLALALHHFQTKKGYWARAVLIKKAVFGDEAKDKEDRIYDWLKIAAAEVVCHQSNQN